MRYLTLIALAVLAFGCGAPTATDEATEKGAATTGSSSEPSGMAEASAPDGWMEVKGDKDISLHVPGDWVSIHPDDSNLDARIDEVNDEITGDNRAQRPTVPPGAHLMAGHLVAEEIENGFMTNINVMSVEYPGDAITMDTIDGEKAALESEMPDVTVSTVDLAAGPALYAHGTQTMQGMTVDTEQYFIYKGNEIYILTLVTPGGNADADMVRKMAESFKFS